MRFARHQRHVQRWRVAHCAESITLTLPEKSDVTLFSPPITMPAVAMTQELWGTRDAVSR